MYDQLKNHIIKFAKPANKELELLSESLRAKEIKKKAFLLKEGQFCDNVCFIVEGCFRSFFINEKGVEKIINFGIEDWWITDYDSFSNFCPTRLYIQAIEDSKILCISKKDLDSILDQSLELNKYFRILMEKVRIADQRRIEYLFNLSGVELYKLFSEAYPDFVQRVPQFMLASYLGFTPEFLSKIRKNI